MANKINCTCSRLNRNAGKQNYLSFIRKGANVVKAMVRPGSDSKENRSEDRTDESSGGNYC